MAANRYHKANNKDLLPPHRKPKEITEGRRCPNNLTLDCYKVAGAKQKDLKNGYDPDEQTSYILYLDANNLHGYAMCQKLPHKDFRWGDAETFDPFQDWGDDTGAYVEVDVEYPSELHDLHQDLPLAPENVNITKDWLSQTQRGMGKKLTAKNHKLTFHFNPRCKYITHAKNLKFYLEHGMKLTKVHRVLYFYQSAWLKPWIDFNTAKRAAAKNEFEKDFYKLMSNAVFGKTMENVRDRNKAFFITTGRCYRKHTGRPTYKNTMDFGGENSRIVFEETPDVELNKPIYTGIAVLELSNILMFQFHYDVFQPLVGAKNLRLGMTDTDSLMYDVFTDDLTKLLEPIKDSWLDTSSYPKDTPSTLQRIKSR